MTYHIRATHVFYGPTKQTEILTDEHMGDPLEFSTRSDALEYIAYRDNEVYHLRHNECQRPEYQPVKVGA